MAASWSCRPDARDVLQRLRRLYEERAQDIILASFRVPSAVLAEYNRHQPEGFCEYPDPRERSQFWADYLCEGTAVRDDALPCAYMSEMDQGLYGALVGGTPRFLYNPENGWVSSMVAPVLKGWSEFDALSFDPNHPWFASYVRQLKTFVDTAGDRFGISHFILIDGLNFVFELFGATRTYEEIIDHPDRIAQAIEFAFQLNMFVQNTFFSLVPPVENGTCSNFAQWLPGRIVSESLDPFHMTSVKYLERWGRANVERVFAQFDGGILHLHANGRHLLDGVATIRGLKALFLGDDKGFQLAFDLLPDLKKRVGDLPLVLKVDFDRFREALVEHRLLGGVFYKVQGVPDVATANQLADWTRAYIAS